MDVHAPFSRLPKSFRRVLCSDIIKAVILGAIGFGNNSTHGGFEGAQVRQEVNCEKKKNYHRTKTFFLSILPLAIFHFSPPPFLPPI